MVGGREPHGARLSHVLIFVLAPGLDKNTWRAEVYEAWCLACWAAAGMGMCWFAGWRAGLAYGMAEGVVLKVGERLAGGTLARVYCESTGLL